MSVNLITNITYPVYTHKKEKANEDKSFANILEAYSAEKDTSAQVTEYTASAEEVQAIAAETGNEFSSVNPSYTITDEEAEYFRKKYGENYDEENLKDFFFELSEKGIISELDAMATTGIAWIAKLEVVGYVPQGTSPLELFKMGKVQLRIGEKQWSTSRDFGYEYEEFKQNYTKDVITWEDYIQERLDFVEYLKDCDVIHQKEGVIPNIYHWNERQSKIERTADIIKQIFG